MHGVSSCAEFESPGQAVVLELDPHHGPNRVRSLGEKIFFPNLDPLRFFAFSVVYLRHGFGDLVNGIDLHHHGLNVLRDGLFNSGDVGVAFFFVLSGFLITYLSSRRSS